MYTPATNAYAKPYACPHGHPYTATDADADSSPAHPLTHTYTATDGCTYSATHAAPVLSR